MKKIISFYLYKDNRRNISYENITSILKDNTYTMILDGIKTVISKDQLIRENEEFTFTLDINNKTATYLLKEKNMLLDIKVEKLDINNLESKIIIEYKLESDTDTIKIEIIEEEDENE